jgi:hypothetical protein
MSKVAAPEPPPPPTTERAALLAAITIDVQTNAPNGQPYFDEPEVATCGIVSAIYTQARREFRR